MEQNPKYAHLAYSPRNRYVPFVTRFQAQVDDSGECWIWTGQLFISSGYGRLMVEGKIKVAHRIAWMMVNGPIPEGLCVCHSCDNRRCVRPSHLFLGTPQENWADMREKKRHSRGEMHPFTKLNPEKVQEIRRRIDAGEEKRALAKEFGVSEMTVHNLYRRRTWAHVP